MLSSVKDVLKKNPDVDTSADQLEAFDVTRQLYQYASKPTRWPTSPIGYAKAIVTLNSESIVKFRDLVSSALKAASREETISLMKEADALLPSKRRAFLHQ